jgi:hypothetical protein
VPEPLPLWPPGTAATLCVSGPHAIALSTAVRADDDRILFALAHRRATLTRLREDPSCALCLLAPNLAFTAEGRAFVVRERLHASDRVAALELRVDRLFDHLADGRTDIVEGVRWRWRDAADADRDRLIRTELDSLAEVRR